jgi:hypothetical protein
MRTEKVAEIVNSAQRLETETQRLIQYLQAYSDAANNSFDVSQLIPTKDSTTAEIFGRIFYVTAFIAKFANTRADNVPLATLTTLLAACDDVAAHEANLINQLELDRTNNGALSHFNYGDFTAQMRNGVVVNLHAAFVNLFQTVENLLVIFSSSLIVLKPSKGAINFQGAAGALTLLLDATRAEHDKLKLELNKTQQLFDGLVASDTEAKVITGEMNRLHKEVINARQTVNEYQAEITQKKAAIDVVSAKSATLEAEVNEYAAKFDSFDRQIESRELALNQGSDELDLLVGSLKIQDSKIADAIARSEQMLASSTTAGLASHFHTIHKDLTKEMNSARRSFNWGIWALFFSAIPLIILIFSPVLFPLLGAIHPAWAADLKTFIPERATDGWQYTGQVISRLIVLVPAAWFVRFSSIRYASLFRLREHYAYKYSMAVSVDGFKKQAPGYQDEIAAMVLEQLAFNPADKLVPSKDMAEGKVPHPLLNYMMAKMDKHMKSLNAEK